MSSQTREQMLEQIEYHRYWQNGFFNNDVNKVKWDNWYINPNDGYVIFGSYQNKKEIMPEAIKLCDTTQQTFETLSDDSLSECLKYIIKQVNLKESILLIFGEQT